MMASPNSHFLQLTVESPRDDQFTITYKAVKIIKDFSTASN